MKMMRVARKKLIVAGTACVAVLLSSCERRYSPWLESKRRPDGSLPEAALAPDVEKRVRAIIEARLATDSLIPADIEPFIEETNTHYVVTWPSWCRDNWWPPGRPKTSWHPNFEYQFSIDKTTWKAGPGCISI